MTETVLDFTEAEIAKLEKAGGRDIFAVVDMAFMTEVPVLFVVPVDVKKKTEVQAVLSFLEDAPWLPDDAKQQLGESVAVELVGNCMVIGLVNNFTNEDLAPDFLAKLHKNMTPAARRCWRRG